MMAHEVLRNYLLTYDDLVLLAKRLQQEKVERDEVSFPLILSCRISEQRQSHPRCLWMKEAYWCDEFQFLYHF